jgi:hypothetical protein
MTLVQFDAGTLTASRENRTMTGLLVPFGEECRSNLGRFTVDAGAFTIPSDFSGMGINTEHQRERVFGAFQSAQETAEGITATFSIANTPAGDQALDDVATGKRKHLSAEVAEVIISKGKAIGGKLFAAALVAVPAFPSATLLAAAADIGLPPAPDAAAVDPNAAPTETVEKFTEEITAEDGTTQTKTTTRTTRVDGLTTTITEEIVIEAAAPAEAPTQEGAPVASVPNTLAATGSTAPAGLTKRDAFGIMLAKHAGTVDSDQLATLTDSYSKADSLFGALSNVKHSGAGAVSPYNTAAQWVDDVWDGVAAEPIISDLIDSQVLTARTIAGYKVTTKPTGGDWAGNGAAITSTGLVTTPYTATAEYFAGGNTISREFFDFGVDSALLNAYFTAQGENYIAWADNIALTGILGDASEVMADNPGSLEIGAGFSALIDGVVQVIANKGGMPTFALVESDLYKSMMKIPQSSILGYLNAALGFTQGELSGFSLRPIAAATGVIEAGEILVGVRQGASLYQLAGTPVRVEALQVATGQIDVGLFGYAAYMTNKADAFVKVTPYVAA